MKAIDPGHRYMVEPLDGGSDQEIRFVKRFRDELNHAGTTNQELLRVLIHRLGILHAELPWDGNEEIIRHLRMALVLHEARALIRKVEKGEINPEDIKVSPVDGHVVLQFAS